MKWGQFTNKKETHSTLRTIIEALIKSCGTDRGREIEGSYQH